AHEGSQSQEGLRLKRMLGGMVPSLAELRPLFLLNIGQNMFHRVTLEAGFAGDRSRGGFEAARFSYSDDVREIPQAGRQKPAHGIELDSLIRTDWQKLSQLLQFIGDDKFRVLKGGQLAVLA